MSIPEGTDWTETQVTMNSPNYSFTMLNTSVVVRLMSEDPEVVSAHPAGPPGNFMIQEVVIPNSTGADLDELMDQIVSLIENFAQPFLSPGASTSKVKKYFQYPTQLIEGS